MKNKKQTYILVLAVTMLILCILAFEKGEELGEALAQKKEVFHSE